MKINDNILLYTVITEIDDNENGWRISANIGENGYYLPCIRKNAIGFFADNGYWILENLLPNLKILLTYKDLENLTSKIIHEAITFELDYLRNVPKNDYQVIVNLIEQAIKIGFFKEYYDKSK